MTLKEGPGTELAKLIPSWVERFAKGCSCKDWVIKMNRWGADGCEKMESAIVSHLVASAKQYIPSIRIMPVSAQKVVAVRLVRLAIKRARAS